MARFAAAVAKRAILHMGGWNAMDKTIDDVTRDELAELAEAAHDLLGAARILFWLGGHDDKEDDSFTYSIDRMAAALAAIGLPRGPPRGDNRRRRGHAQIRRCLRANGGPCRRPGKPGRRSRPGRPRLAATASRVLLLLEGHGDARLHYSIRSVALAAVLVCHCIFSGASAPPRLMGRGCCALHVLS